MTRTDQDGTVLETMCVVETRHVDARLLFSVTMQVAFVPWK